MALEQRPIKRRWSSIRKYSKVDELVRPSAAEPSSPKVPLSRRRPCSRVHKLKLSIRAMSLAIPLH